MKYVPIFLPSRVSYGPSSSLTFPSSLLPEKSVQKSLDGIEQVECMCVDGRGRAWWPEQGADPEREEAGIRTKAEPGTR